jgi:hypothetical protein
MKNMTDSPQMLVLLAVLCVLVALYLFIREKVLHKKISFMQELSIQIACLHEIRSCVFRCKKGYSLHILFHSSLEIDQVQVTLFREIKQAGYTVSYSRYSDDNPYLKYVNFHVAGKKFSSRFQLRKHLILRSRDSEGRSLYILRPY